MRVGLAAAHAVVGVWRVSHREPCLACLGRGSPTEQVEHLADRPFAADRVTQWEMLLNPVAVAPPGLLLDHVPGIDEIGHEAVCAALGDADLDGDVTDTYAGVVGDAEQRRAGW